MKCIECENEAKWYRCTQFSGDHYYCTKHALLEKDFSNKAGDPVWMEIVHVFCPCESMNNSIIKFVRNVEYSTRILIDVSDNYLIFTCDDIKKEIEKAEYKHIDRLHSVYKFIQKYTVKEVYVSETISEMYVNAEKIHDDINLNIITQDLYDNIEILEKTGHIIWKEASLNEDFTMIKHLTFKFKNSEIYGKNNVWI